MFVAKTDWKKGVALLVALGTVIVILIIGSLAIYMITTGLNIARGQREYQSAFEACEGGVEIGIAKIDSAFNNRVLPQSDTLNIGRFEVQIITEPLFAAASVGSAIRFARGYFGVGQGISQGGINLFYLIHCQSIGVGGEQITIDIEQKKVPGID